MLNEDSFVKDWCEHMGDLCPITSKNVIEYINKREESLRAQADAGPVGVIDDDGVAWAYKTKNGAFNLPAGTKLYTHPSLPAAQGLSDAKRYAEWRHLTERGQWSDGVPAWARDHEGRMNDVTAMRAVIEELASILTRAATVAEPSDSTSQLHVGESSFESWYAAHIFEHANNFKQNMRDAYAAGMGDPLVMTRKSAQHQAEPPKCQRCGADTADSCEGAGCGYLTAGNGEQQAEPVGDELPKVVNTLGGFRGGFIGVHGRAPTEQEIWNGGVRSGLDRAAQSGQRAVLAEDARECLLDVVSHHGDFATACKASKVEREASGDRDSASYWQHQVDVLARMKAQAARALAAAPTQQQERSE